MNNKGKVGQAVVDFSVYDNIERLLGVANVTMPSLSFLTTQISGAGVAGNIEAVMPLLEAMTLGMQWLTLNEGALSLCGPERHTITLREVQRQESALNRQMEIVPMKHVFVAVPKSLSGGSLAQATPSNPNGEYAVRYWKATRGDQVLIEIDPTAYKCVINGVDYLEPVRKAMGM